MFIDLRERERERERIIHQLPPVCAPAGDPAPNLRMCSDWGLNPLRLVYGTMLQPTEPPGQGCLGFDTGTVVLLESGVTPAASSVRWYQLVNEPFT